MYILNTIIPVYLCDIPFHLLLFYFCLFLHEYNFFLPDLDLDLDLDLNLDRDRDRAGNGSGTVPTELSDDDLPIE